MSTERDTQLSQARDTFHTIMQISKLLQTGLDAETLTLCVRLCELGVDAVALASVIKELRHMAESENSSGDTS